MSTVQILKQNRLHEFAQVLRTTRFKQIKTQPTDGKDGRCALGVIAEYLGRIRNDYGCDYHNISKELGFGCDEIWGRNDSGLSFEQIADWLDSL